MTIWAKKTKTKSITNSLETEISHNISQVKKFTHMGSCSSVLLLSLIEDILDLSKMEAGTFKINKEFMLIPELIDEVCDIFSTQCKQRNIELIAEVEECLSNINFHSDRSRLKQILLNLLSNSSKFTFKGHIKLSVKVVEQNRMYLVEF